MKKIIIMIDYFGEAWPEWIDLFFLSCSRNPTITWLIHTDCSCDEFSYPNVIFSKMSWVEYKAIVSRRLGVNFNPEHKYKICDLRPALGCVWEDEITDYDFYGYGDIDVIYGDIRRFYTDEILKNNVISTHEWCFSGHLSLFKNKKWVRNAFRQLPNWREVIESKDHHRFDEDHYFRVFMKPNRFTPKRKIGLTKLLDLVNPFRIKYRKIYLREQYTTPLVWGLWRGADVKHSEEWYWKEGKITNRDNGDREFIYLHFMNFASARYMDAKYGVEAPWKKLNRIVNVDIDRLEDGFCIGLNGITPYT